MVKLSPKILASEEKATTTTTTALTFCKTYHTLMLVNAREQSRCSQETARTNAEVSTIFFFINSANPRQILALARSFVSVPIVRSRRTLFCHYRRWVKNERQERQIEG